MVHQPTRQGPGGGRNLLIGEAKSPLIASFDDDSWPVDADFFSLAEIVFASHPEAAILDGQVVIPAPGR